jgi:2-polyprenyl-3-methyl-5-hydroxy-6-metoxy-1,4-benzoquinol methylase
MAVNPDKLNAFMGKAVGDIGAALSANMVLLGDKLGLYKAMVKSGPVTPAELAKATKTTERYVREWLGNQAAGGYVTYDAGTGRYHLPEEQAMALADESSPCFLPGAFQVIAATFSANSKIEQRFKTGKGLGWDQHDHRLFEGTERFFRPNYLGNLVANWIPSLDGVEAKLKRGAKVADVGCGFGASTIIMAKAYPTSTFIGFDYHKPSILTARKRAKEAGLKNVTFAAAKSTNYPGKEYDFVAHFDCLHDMTRPDLVMLAIRKAIKPDGTWLIADVHGMPTFEDNLRENPLAPLMYGFSVLCCMSSALSEPDGLGLGTLGFPEPVARKMTAEAGFTRFTTKDFENPINAYYEVRP